MQKDEYALSFGSFGLYILRLTPFEFFEVNWYNYYTSKSFGDART